VAAGVLGAVAGLVTFGVVADVGNRFAVAAVLTFLPAACFAALFWLVPETRGKEPEDLWPARLSLWSCPTRRRMACRRWVARGVNDGRTGR